MHQRLIIAMLSLVLAAPNFGALACCFGLVEDSLEETDNADTSGGPESSGDIDLVELAMPLRRDPLIGASLSSGLQTKLLFAGNDRRPANRVPAADHLAVGGGSGAALRC